MCLDYDDAQLATLPSRPMGQQTHPTTPCWPQHSPWPKAGELQEQRSSTAYIVGVEVACRLGDAVDPSHYLDGFHPTGTLGAFGATAACAHLLKLPPRSIRHALGIAGTLASGLRANRGTMAKGLNAGRAAENGVLAATLAADGFTASQNIFDDPMGFFSRRCAETGSTPISCDSASHSFSPNPVWRLSSIPAPGVLHPALDLTLNLRQRHSIDAKNIDRIRVTSRCQRRLAPGL